MTDSASVPSDPGATLSEFISAAKKFSEITAFKNAESIIDSYKQLQAKVKAQDELVMKSRTDYIRTKQELDRSNERFLRAHREETQTIVNDKSKLQVELDRLQAEIAQEKSRFHGLSEEMKDLQHQLNEGGKHIKKLQDDIASLKHGKTKLEGEVTRVNNILRDRSVEIKEQKAKIKGLEKSGSDLSNDNAILDAKNQEQSIMIKQIHNFAPSCIEDDITNLKQSLEKLWQGCFEAVTKCFDVDIATTVLEDQQVWRIWRDIEVIPSDVPLSPTNGTPAKRIRTVATMAVLAESLVQHIFTPTYLLFNDDEFRNISFHLATTEADRERFLRQVLNGTCKDKQLAVKTQRMSSVLKRVFTCVHPLIDEKVGESFKTTLSQLLAEATELWSGVQRMGSFFDTDVAFDTNIPWRWRAISWTKQSNEFKEREIDPEHLHDLDVCLVLFPRIFIVTDSVDQPVFPGIVLSRSETRAAKEEWDKIRQSKPMLGRSSTSTSMRPRRMTLNQANGTGESFLG